MKVLERSTKDIYTNIDYIHHFGNLNIGGKNTFTDNAIENIFKSANLSSVNQFTTEEDVVKNMDKLASSNHIHLFFYDGHSEWNTIGGQINIFINNKNTIDRQWEDFGFMFSNIILFFNRKVKNVQDFELTKDSATLAHLICVPSFIINQMKELNNADEKVVIEFIKNQFKVSHSFAEKSYALIYNKIPSYQSMH